MWLKQGICEIYQNQQTHSTTNFSAALSLLNYFIALRFNNIVVTIATAPKHVAANQW
jgi:hypothetical protein